MTLHDLPHWVALFVVCGGGGLTMIACIWVAEAIETRRVRLRRRRTLQLEQYRAEQAIHIIRRQAIHDMLEAERTHPNSYDGDVIEGTAVEVRR